MRIPTSVLHATNRQAINLNNVRAKVGLPQLVSSSGHPRTGVDFIPPLNCGLLNSAPKKLSSTALKASNQSLPAYFNWCDSQSVKNSRPSKKAISFWVGDQGQCGDCWSYSSSTAFADRWNILNNTSLQFSPTWLASCSYSSSECNSGESSTPVNCGCNGGYPSLAADFIQTTGLVTMDCDPYSSVIYNAKGPNSGAPACGVVNTCKNQLLYKAQSYGGLSNPTQIMNEIFQNGPVVVGFAVFDNFMTPDTKVDDWSKNLIYDHVSDDENSGGHAVVIVGWGHDSKYNLNYWIVRNSWTTGWNPNNYVDSANGKLKMPGFFKIAITGLNPGSPNSDIGFDSNEVAGGVVWALATTTPAPMSPVKTCSNSKQCGIGQTCVNKKCSYQNVTATNPMSIGNHWLALLAIVLLVLFIRDPIQMFKDHLVISSVIILVILSNFPPLNMIFPASYSNSLLILLIVLIALYKYRERFQ